MDAPTQDQRNVRRQLAILEVAAQADGQSTDEIVGMLRAAMARRRVSAPPMVWLQGVARDASVGVAYVISAEAMDEARRRLERSLLDGFASPDGGAGGSAEAAGGGGHAGGRARMHQVLIDAPVPGRSAQLRGFLGVPAGTGPWPAVVMLHEAFAIDEVMLRQVERMATAGYLVLMPDLFSAGGPRRCLAATFRALSNRQGRAFEDIEAARRWLLARADTTGAVGVLGFCMGGGFALVAASRGFDAASVNYGMIPKDVAEVLQGACPVVGSYGGRDRMLARAVPRLKAALEAHHIDHDVKTYPTAGHSFLNDTPSGPAWIRPVLKLVAGVGPDPDAAADAWRRIEEFFRQYLVEAAPRGRE